MPNELTTNQKDRCLEVSSSLILCINYEAFLDWIVTCEEKWILYDSQLSNWTKKKLQSTSKSQTCTRTGHGHWWSAASLIHFNFLNPSETITSEKYAQQINEMNWKLQTLKPAWVSRKWLSSSAWQLLTTCHTGALDVEWIGLQSFASSAIFTWPLANWLPLIQTSWQHFAWKTLSKSLLNPEAWIFMLQE